MSQYMRGNPVEFRALRHNPRNSLRQSAVGAVGLLARQYVRAALRAQWSREAIKQGDHGPSQRSNACPLFTVGEPQRPPLPIDLDEPQIGDLSQTCPGQG